MLVFSLSIRSWRRKARSPPSGSPPLRRGHRRRVVARRHRHERLHRERVAERSLRLPQQEARPAHGDEDGEAEDEGQRAEEDVQVRRRKDLAELSGEELLRQVAEFGQVVLFGGDQDQLHGAREDQRRDTPALSLPQIGLDALDETEAAERPQDVGELHERSVSGGGGLAAPRSDASSGAVRPQDTKLISSYLICGEAQAPSCRHPRRDYLADEGSMVVPLRVERLDRGVEEPCWIEIERCEHASLQHERRAGNPRHRHRDRWLGA